MAATTFQHHVVLVRHGETEWSRDHKHTGRTDIPLTDHGREQARALRAVLHRWTFAAVFVSPLSRARETCDLAGYGRKAQLLDDLLEWDYGEYEGKTTAEIRRSHPGWNIWKDGAPGGEPLEHAGARADQVIRRVGEARGDVLLIAHGHFLRILTARWIGQPPLLGQHLLLDPASPCVLFHEHDWTSVQRWNVSG